MSSGVGRASDEIAASVARIDVVKWRLAQALLPIATIAGIVARRSSNCLATFAAFGFLAAATATFLIARRSFGLTRLSATAGRISLGNSAIEIPSSQVTRWTLEGNCARLYGGRTSWKLVSHTVDGNSFRSLLAGTLGPPKQLRRRGTPTARRIALCISVVGLVSSAAGISLDIVVLAVVGIPSFVVGLATFGALSQKVTS